MRPFLLSFIILLVTVFPAQAKTLKTVLAGGCFWSMEKAFDKAPGVIGTVVGYAGGSREQPTYKNYNDAGDTITPHVEAIEVTYDSAETDYAALLDYYFRHIDPTDGRGQFCDYGVGYKPVIFVESAQERAIAEKSKSDVADILGKPVAVEIRDAGRFWPAEAYHQDFYLKNPQRYERYAVGCGRDAKLKAVWEGK